MKHIVTLAFIFIFHSTVFNQQTDLDTLDNRPFIAQRSILSSKIVVDDYGQLVRTNITSPITRKDIEEDLFENSIYEVLFQQEKANQQSDQTSVLLQTIKNQLDYHLLSIDSLNNTLQVKINSLEQESMLLKSKIIELENIAKTTTNNTNQRQDNSKNNIANRDQSTLNITDYALLAIIFISGLALLLLFQRLKKAWFEASLIS